MRDRGLTTQQAEVLRRVSLGMTNEEIAEDLGAAPNTVRTHVQNVLLRLGARNRAHAVRLLLDGASRQGENLLDVDVLGKRVKANLGAAIRAGVPVEVRMGGAVFVLDGVEGCRVSGDLKQEPVSEQEPREAPGKARVRWWARVPAPR